MHIAPNFASFHKDSMIKICRFVLFYNVFTVWFHEIFIYCVFYDFVL